MAQETAVLENTNQEEAVKTEWKPTILGILCNWCSYAGADLAGSARMQYPATVRIVRVPCSGRADRSSSMRNSKQ